MACEPLSINIPRMEKSLTYKSMFSELSRLVYAFSNGKFYRYLLDNAGLKIRMRWPKRTCIVIGTVDSWPLCAPSYEAICNIFVNAICCDHKFDICGYIEYMDGDVANLHTLFLVLEDPQRFYVVDTEGKCIYLVGENIHVFSKCGLYRCDEMFRVPAAKYTVKVDELLAELIECKDDVPKFGAVLESRVNKRYLMRSRYSDEKYILMLFILRKGSFPNKYDWDKIHDTLDDLPQDSIIIGCIGRGLVYPKTCVLVLGSDRAVYGISTIGPHFQTGQNCMKLADDFDMFLRMGFSRCAGYYKFLARDGGRALHDAQPTCPHYNDAEDGIADFDTSDDE